MALYNDIRRGNDISEEIANGIQMVRPFCIVFIIAFAIATAKAEHIYTDNTGRTLRMYYSWTVDPNGLTKLDVQLVNYSSVTWVDIVLNCDITGFGSTRPARKEIPLNSPVFDFELSKVINDIDIGQTQPKADLNCSIVQASHGEPTLKPTSR
jgi:hypothetical protein